MNRVEHVDHVEDLKMGFHPIPRKRANLPPLTFSAWRKRRGLETAVSEKAVYRWLVVNAEAQRRRGGEMV